ncbi:MAG: OmpA family protein [Pseudomonadota bacterium]|nr:OmpA family protein [Pseudomonadota bacterium]
MSGQRVLKTLALAGLLSLTVPAWALILGSESGVLVAPTATKATMSQLSQRLQPFLVSQDVLTQYHARKAQSWLDYAKEQNSEGSLTSAYQTAMQQVELLVGQLEQGQQPTMATAVPVTSGVMRRDLWAIAELLKTHPAFDQVQQTVAKAEVKLVWAAAEHCELGWRHSREHFAAAERWLYVARQQANQVANAPAWPENLSYPSLESLNGTGKGCQGVQGDWPIPVPAWHVPVVPVPQPQPEVDIRAELIKVPNNVHFALDKHFLSAESKAVLDQIVSVLKQYPDVSVTLYGYTDSRASVAYNLALSERRARSVEQYLVAQGIDLNRIAREAKGKTQLLTDQNPILGHALSRRVEVVFASAGEEIITERQTADLQPERPID